MKTGIVDVGGGYRGVYAAGVMDVCLEQSIFFDVGIGVSAGSANLVTYAAGQRGRTLRFYTEFGLRRRYAGMGNFLLRHSYIDLDYVYSTLSNSDGEYPLDYNALRENPMELVVVATEAKTGQARYFSKEDIAQDDYNVMKASSAIPFVCHPYAVGDTLYFDGALSDPVPVDKALSMGCDRVVLVLTLPVDTVRTSEKDEKLAERIQREYPMAAERLRMRAARYNESVKRARELAAQGKVLMIAPDDTCGVHTLCRNAEAMRRLYQKGHADAERIQSFLREPIPINPMN